MRRSLLWLVVMALLAILLPAFAADDNTDAATKPDAKDKKQYDKLIKSGKAFIGKLVKMNADQHSLTVEVTYKSPKQDPQVAQNLANLQLQLVDAQRQRNPVERLKHVSHIQIEIEKNTRNLFKDVTQKLELDAPDNMKVRTMVLPVELDDKGKPRRLTEKEKKELKGPDPTLPGYTGDFDSLKVDQIVEVYLAKQPAKSKPTTSPRPQNAADDKDRDTNNADNARQDTKNTDNTRPRIAMIVILAEAKK